MAMENIKPQVRVSIMDNLKTGYMMVKDFSNGAMISTIRANTEPGFVMVLANL